MSLIIAPSSAEWPRLFLAHRDTLRAAFAPVDVDIEHIGSTSVPGLAAKPVIDILVGAASLADIESRIPALVAAGFTYRPEHESALPTRRYFTLTPSDSLRVHVHAVVRGDTLWRDHLAFRDALLNDDALRERYQALKLALAQRHAHDKSAYTEAKGPFIREVIVFSSR
jgi:GrpB-like predicted nucleotidyltransferase (UPF0157 family)